MSYRAKTVRILTIVHRMHPGELGIIASAKERAEPSREQLQSLVLSLSYYIQVLFNSGRCQNQSNTIQDGWPCRGFMEPPPAYANILSMRCSTIRMAVRYFAKGILQGVYYFRPLHAEYLHYEVVSEKICNKSWSTLRWDVTFLLQFLKHLMMKWKYGKNKFYLADSIMYYI